MRFHRWPSSCRPATSNRTLSVRVFYQSASTDPCCIHLVLPLKQSTNTAMLMRSISGLQPHNINQNAFEKFSRNKTQINLGSVPDPYVVFSFSFSDLLFWRAGCPWVAIFVTFNAFFPCFPTQQKLKKIVANPLIYKKFLVDELCHGRRIRRIR